MDKDNKHGNAEQFPGLIEKAASLSVNEVSEDDLRAINKYALAPLNAEDVFTFKSVLCDNEVDRQFERFTVKALEEMRKLFLGKTVIKNHSWNANDQVARIYKTELVQDTTKTTKSGELYTKLVAYCYMVKTAGNADLIAEIKGGIKKEGSVGFAASSAICSICGTDNAKSFCRHWPGKSYDKEGGKEVCTFTLAGVRDAYEFSLVAVPAQRAAGISKSYTGETLYDDPETPEEPETQDADAGRAKKLDIRAHINAIKAKHNNL